MLTRHRDSTPYFKTNQHFNNSVHRFDRAIDEALDAYCAQLRYQDTDANIPPALMTFAEMRDRFFPHFETWFGLLLGQKGVNLPVSRHRMVAAVIGAAYGSGVDASHMSDQQWTNLVELIRRPQDISAKFGNVWPVSKGRWDGAKGYRAQIAIVQTVVKKICE